MIQTNVQQTLLFYAATEKQPLKCMLIYNFVSPSVNLFLAKACCIFAPNYMALCIPISYQ